MRRPLRNLLQRGLLFLIFILLGCASQETVGPSADPSSIVEVDLGVSQTNPADDVSTPEGSPSSNTPDKPSVPIDFRAVPGDQTVTLHWSPNTEGAEVAGYVFYMAETSWDTWSEDLTGGVRQESVSCCAFTKGGLVNGRVYYFALAAVNGSGESPESFHLSATPGTSSLSRSLQWASLSDLDEEANAQSGLPVISGDGRYIAFQSTATNLVAGDTNGVQDIFVRDLLTGTTRRVNLGPGGEEGNASSLSVWINGDGRYLSFWSFATNLVPSDTNDVSDVFRRDMETGETVRVSVSSSGAESRNICDTDPDDGVVPPCNFGSNHSAISADGMHVSFRSYGDNLVDGDLNGFSDIFIRDLTGPATTLASVSSSGTQGNDHPDIQILSSDGRYVVFDSKATNMVADDNSGSKDAFLHDNRTGVTLRVSQTADGGDAQTLDTFGSVVGAISQRPSISADGRYVAYFSDAFNLVPDDSNGEIDVFVYDRETGVTVRASVDSSGGEAHGKSERPFLSGDGRYVAFTSTAPDLVAGDTNGISDVFVRDLQLGMTARVSVNTEGEEANGVQGSFWTTISIDGRYIGFSSDATNLVDGGTNGQSHIFVAPNPLFPW